MPSIYQLKPAFQRLLRPSTARLAAANVTANHVTLSAALLSMVLGALLAFFPHITWLYALVPVWMLVRMALNAIDGILAREYGQQSKLGAYLNELCDIVSDIALYLPFALLAGISAYLVVATVLLSLISEYAGVLGTAVGATRRYDGPMGKSDRALCFGLIGIGVGTGILAPLWINLLLVVMSLLLLRTTYNRVRCGLTEAA